ncbi:Putative NTF2-like domain superfamily protein [Septoria linicola]|uniref:NTF2-like domain superfamily protein n=1 Tax=Septoria linicola TaxID=215465 RepID=A0A9Q9AQ59_9PEZI|nr:putative NTF2-like domain superfamily protein [Septoria linicola]USW52449.1 Putative NTF2-like domain superfamily protein [Septoria linicola]
MRPFARHLSKSLRTTSPPIIKGQAVSARFAIPTTRGLFQAVLPSTTFRMSSTSADVGELKIENTNIKSAPGVDLSQQQKTLIGSVLDLFAGRPSLAKLQLWQDDAQFIDPLTIAKGRKQFEPQWYGLQTAFSEIERLHHEVTSGGNPIELDLKSRYVVKGIGKEQIISSKVKIWSDGDKITKVHDEWDGKLPESSIAQAFQRLNANTVPYVVGVPKNAEEDAKKGNQ